MARSLGARARLALGFETAYGTPPASGFVRMPFAPGLTVAAEQPLLDSELLGYGREATALWLHTMVALTAGDTVELQGKFRAADGYFAADHTSFWGCKVG